MKKTFKVEGMHCKSCEVLIMDSIEDLGARASVDWKKGEVSVEFDEKKIPLLKVVDAIKSEGYKVKKE